MGSALEDLQAVADEMRGAVADAKQRGHTAGPAWGDVDRWGCASFVAARMLRGMLERCEQQLTDYAIGGVGAVSFQDSTQLASDVRAMIGRL